MSQARKHSNLKLVPRPSTKTSLRAQIRQNLLRELIALGRQLKGGVR